MEHTLPVEVFDYVSNIDFPVLESLFQHVVAATATERRREDPETVKL